MNVAPPINISQRLLHLPAVRGVIERRMLVNFRCAPDALARILPAPFRPKLIHGWGMAGICLIRLGAIRPAFLPPIAGLRSENAAHRIAVEWDEDGRVREGVFIPRRDTNSLLNRVAGGKIFPGVHHAAVFRAWETGGRYKVELGSEDGTTFMRVVARESEELPESSIFRSLAEASDFFRGGALGWSARERVGEFDGLELRCDEWRMRPLMVERVESSFFSDRSLFPAKAATFDSGFLMRNLNHAWHTRGRMLCNKNSCLP